jgi:hypothetical protein
VAARTADELDDHAVRVAQEQHGHAAEPGARQLDELGGGERFAGVCGQLLVSGVDVVDAEGDPVEAAVVGGRGGQAGALRVLPLGQLEGERGVAFCDHRRVGEHGTVRVRGALGRLSGEAEALVPGDRGVQVGHVDPQVREGRRPGWLFGELDQHPVEVGRPRRCRPSSAHRPVRQAGPGTAVLSGLFPRAAQGRHGVAEGADAGVVRLGRVGADGGRGLPLEHLHGRGGARPAVVVEEPAHGVRRARHAERPAVRRGPRRLHPGAQLQQVSVERGGR